MFRKARIKLTIYYLAIIMAISSLFSFIIYKGAASELERIQVAQQLRKPSVLRYIIEPEIVEETKARVIATLLVLNGVILVVAGAGGYFLAGKTLEPIKRNMETQKGFVSDASHALRTPITTLRTEIEVGLRDKSIKLDDAKKILQSNLEEVGNIQKLTENLLRLSKLEGKPESLEKHPVDLKRIVNEAIGKRKLKKSLKTSIINGDENALVELFSILIDNAIKYSPGGKGVIVSIKGKSVTVTDNGFGISQNDLPHIFDRFYRGNVARSKSGYGLGLSIAKQIADMHNAKIEVKSKTGAGSTFKVIFS